MRDGIIMASQDGAFICDTHSVGNCFDIYGREPAGGRAKCRAHDDLAWQFFVSVKHHCLQRFHNAENGVLQEIEIPCFHFKAISAISSARDMMWRFTTSGSTTPFFTAPYVDSTFDYNMQSPALNAFSAAGVHRSVDENH